MAVFDSPITTYSDATPHRRAITDVISLIDPTDTPAIAALGGLDGAAAKFRFVNWPSKTVEWLEDTHAPLSDALNESASITSTVTTITVTDASLYEPGYLLLIDSELMWTSSTDLTSNVLTVTRGVAGTTAASHASNASIEIISNARVEGAESTPIAFTDRSVGSNVTQIFHQEVKVSRSHLKLSQYGIADEMAYQKDKAVPATMRQIEKHLFYSKGLSTGSATVGRIMNGFQGFITTNKVSGASLSQAAFENAVLSAYNNGGGGPWVAFVNPVNKQKIKNFYDTTGVASNTVLRVSQDTREVGMDIDRINTPFGVVDLVMTRWVPTSIIPIVDLKHAGLITYDPFQWEELAKTGDYERAEVVGEFSFCLRQEKAHAILTNVS